ncbi:hypothetical protein WICPIJ_010046 [Wickerhamomyces pijperi]|uniref:Uncharacterized protein n=1 Tax=Wickerhamomyces pijperi TaxID=599730 RepID=A0A9P8PJ21_WICPI|nr:hypothetical protein WICPIJ_010046 [Wickerhamomyces pijperi]
MFKHTKRRDDWDVVDCSCLKDSYVAVWPVWSLIFGSLSRDLEQTYQPLTLTLNPVLKKIVSVWADAYSSQSSEGFFTASTTTISSGTIPDVAPTHAPTTSAAVSSSSDVEFSCVASSEAVVESSSTSTYESVISFLSSTAKTSTSTSASSTTPSSTISIVSSAASDPIFSGILVSDGSALFDLKFPVELGPWIYVSADVSGQGLAFISHGEFIDGVGSAVSGAKFNNDSLAVTVSESMSSALEITVSSTPTLALGKVVATAVAAIDRPNTNSLTKREVSSTTIYAIASAAASDVVLSSSFSVTDLASSSTDTAVDNVSSYSIDPASAAVSSSTDAASFTDVAERTPTAVITKQTSTMVTITSCSNKACSEVPVTNGVSVITTTSNGVESVYTTYCPLTSTETVGSPKTTHVTITSCSNNVCSKITIVSTSAPVHTTDAAPVSSDFSSTSSSDKTDTVSSDFSIVEQGSSSVGTVSTFEGQGSRLVAGIAFVLLLFLF